MTKQLKNNCNHIYALEIKSNQTPFVTSESDHIEILSNGEPYGEVTFFKYCPNCGVRQRLDFIGSKDKHFAKVVVVK